MVTESLYSPQNLHICSQIFCTAALLILKETVLIGDPEAVLHSDWKSVKKCFFILLCLNSKYKES